MPGPRTPPPLHLRQQGAVASAVARRARLLARLQGFPPDEVFRRGYLAAYNNCAYRQRTTARALRRRLDAGEAPAILLEELLRQLES